MLLIDIITLIFLFVSLYSRTKKLIAVTVEVKPLERKQISNYTHKKVNCYVPISFSILDNGFVLVT